jgi:hypothetical protein
VRDREDLCVLPLCLHTAAQPCGLNANEHDDRFARVDELVRFDAPLSPRGTPIREPAADARVPFVLALIRSVVVVDQDTLVKPRPRHFSGGDVLLKPSL